MTCKIFKSFSNCDLYSRYQQLNHLIVWMWGCTWQYSFTFFLFPKIRGSTFMKFIHQSVFFIFFFSGNDLCKHRACNSCARPLKKVGPFIKIGMDFTWHYSVFLFCWAIHQSVTCLAIYSFMRKTNITTLHAKWRVPCLLKQRRCVGRSKTKQIVLLGSQSRYLTFQFIWAYILQMVCSCTFS